MSVHSSDKYRLHQRVTACVERIFPFGVFVRLPDGTPAYVRRRELTQAGNVDPRQVVTEGDEVEGIVIALADANRNLELSVRLAQPDPWESFSRSVKVHDTVIATVKNLSADEVFVQVVPGVDGWIPRRELAPWPVQHPDELLWIGDRVEAMVTHLDRQHKRLHLSIARQMAHQAQVRKVLAFLEDSPPAEDKPPAVAPSQEDTASLPRDAVSPAIADRVGSVLVVDDHDEIRKPLVEWLRRQGFAAEGVSSLEEAAIRVRQNHYGVALVDLNVDGRDGLEFIRMLEQTAPHIHVMVMSAPEWLARQSELLAVSTVLDAFVKPLNLDEIREVLIRLGCGEPLSPLWHSRFQPPSSESRAPFRPLDTTMRSGLSLQARFERGLRELVHFTRAEQGLVFHLSRDSRQVTLVARYGDLPLNSEAIYDLLRSPVKDVIREKRKVFVSHVSRQASSQFNNLLALLPFESCLGVPISAEGEVEYALFLFHREPEAFSHYRLRDAQAMAVLFSVALEHQRLEQRLQKASPFLVSGHLAAGLGHEVYNKVSGIELQMRNLRADCHRLVQQATDLPPTTAELNALAEAAGDLLDVTLDLKKTVTLFQELLRAEQHETVSVNEILRRTVQLLRPTARQHSVRLELALAPHLPPFSGSRMRLQQVFANVILNSIQHTARKMERWREGKGWVRITSEWVQDAPRPLLIHISDNGPGIHRQLWEMVFALGYSTRPSGTGLGLFIARHLIESMGGHIAIAQSTIPTGTTFRIELPAGEEKI